MASPQQDRLAVTTPSPVLRPLLLTPGSRVLDTSTATPSSSLALTPLSDEAIWKKLGDSGFTKESIKRRDKAALIAYIAHLEAKIYDLQHNMGLLILESKDWASKYEQAKLSTESAEILHKRDRAASSSALAEARKRGDNLERALGIEKECVENLEKTLRVMRAECAEVKVSAESKIAEARCMSVDAEKKYTEAEAKLHAAESLQAEANRYHRVAERKLQEVEAHEEDLRRRIMSFKSECDGKEKENMLERQSLSERNKILNQEQDRLLVEKDLLNKKEADVLDKLQELSRLAKELEAVKESISVDRRALMLERSNLELDKASVSEREKAVIEKETSLNQREQELLISQEKLATKEHDHVQKLIAEQESALKTRMTEFDAGLEMRRKLVEEEIGAKRRAWELKELDIKYREEIIVEKELELDVQIRKMADKDKDIMERLSVIKERESNVEKAEKEVELKKLQLQKEKEEVDRDSLKLQKSLFSLEAKKEEIINAEMDLQIMKSETSELFILETRLKEEIDMVRNQKLELQSEAEKLETEKAKFELEWELIDEKRAELRIEEERIAEERLAISKHLKEERDSLNIEREKTRNQYKQDLQLLRGEHEANLNELQSKRSEFLAQIQREWSDMQLEFQVRKRELEDNVSRRHEEIESYLAEKEIAFEEEKKKELEYISSVKESVKKDQERITLDMKRLEAQRVQINLDREQRDKEWAELNKLIEELKVQRQKLKKQRELLHADRGEIHDQIEHLKELENLKIPSDKIVVPELPSIDFSSQSIQATQCFEFQSMTQVPKLRSDCKGSIVEEGLNHSIHSLPVPGSSSPAISSISWFKRWILKRSSDGPFLGQEETGFESEFEDEGLRLDGARYAEKDTEIRSGQGLLPMENLHYLDIDNDNYGLSGRAASEEPKVIHEVPATDLNAKGVHDFDSQSEIDIRENSLDASHRTPSGRKRRKKMASAPPIVDGDDQKQNKKRKQAHDILPSGIESTQPNPCEDEHLVTSVNQSQGNFESVEFLPDKTTATRELNQEIIEVDAENTRSDPIALQSSDLVSNLEVIQDDRSSLVKHGAVSFLIEEQTIIEEVLLVDDKGASTLSEGPAGNDTKELEHTDPSNAKSNKHNSAKEGITTRSMSKQNL
ncbi:hypothetical protein Dimus_017592 [Dionaea muscipula]